MTHEENIAHLERLILAAIEDDRLHAANWLREQLAKAEQESDNG